MEEANIVFAIITRVSLITGIFQLRHNMQITWRLLNHKIEKRIVYWKCLVMSPGSEISLGMQVIISVLATCNT